VGKRRFEILLTNEEKSYLRASVEFFDDEGSDTPGETEAGNAARLFRERRLAEPEVPGGVNRQAERLRAEAHLLLPGTGKRAPRVALSEPRAR
jgi:Lon protease-like protein